MAQPIIIYHRGRHGEDIRVDESTIPAIQHALNEGAESIEVDIRFHEPSGNIFVTHDLWLARTTNGKCTLNDYSFEQLRTLRTNYGSQLATFDEVLEVVHGRCLLVLDIKSPKAALIVAKKIARVGTGHKNFLFSSFHHETLRIIKQSYPWARTGAIMDCIPMTEYINKLAASGVSTIHIEKDNVYMDREKKYEFREAARKHGMNILVWTVNSKAIFQDMAAYGADGVFTDYPKLLVQKKP